MRVRSGIVLAVLAALLWAPSTVSAAANELQSAVVAPTSGTPGTTVVLRVDDGGSVPAQRVEVAIEIEMTAADQPAAPDEHGSDPLTVLGLWSALLAVVGGLMLAFVARRRQRPGPDSATVALAAETTALLERRALRRAHTILPDDPIVSSLGIEAAADQPARRARARGRSARPLGAARWKPPAESGRG